MIVDLVRERGPLTVAAFMDVALYDPEVGYYARAVQRSGRAGDFFTSVDVGSLFGELLAVQLAEMWRVLDAQHPLPHVEIVEAGAGNGRLSADILRAGRIRDSAWFDAVRLHLVEASARARAAQHETLGDVADRIVSSRPSLPDRFEGVLFANELLDALPAHQVVMREDGLREVYVADSSYADSSYADSSYVVSGLSRTRGDENPLALVEGPLSTPALARYLAAVGAELEPGWRAEVNLRAIDWIRSAARALTRGFIILIDYGHEARELYSASHSAGTLTTFRAHRAGGADSLAPPWLQAPGSQDISAHVDFTSIRAAAEAEGLDTLGFLDQTYFLMGLLPALIDPEAAIRNPQWKTLIMPGGLGSTQKVLLFGKGVGTPPLRGCSYKVRVT
jgi:SAM-dependent MidA family methyltransferase